MSIRPGEQGLLGLAFHPDFASNGRFYVDYTERYSNSDVDVEEFSVSRRDPNLAAPESERPLLRIAKPYPAHNGGTIRFGPDGYLYVTVGDGGWQGDPYDNAQSRFTLLGKILRLDVDGGGPGQPYGIPPDNPFAGPGRFDNPYPGPAARSRQDAGRGRIAQARAIQPLCDRHGPASARRCGRRSGRSGSAIPGSSPSTRRRATSTSVTSGEWPGRRSTSSRRRRRRPELRVGLARRVALLPDRLTECPRQQVGVLPVAEYQHGDEGCAVIGIGVYRGEEYPALDGIYFSGDFCTGKIRGLQRDAAGVWQFQELLDPAMLVTSSGQDAAGEHLRDRAHARQIARANRPRPRRMPCGGWSPPTRCRRARRRRRWAAVRQICCRKAGTETRSLSGTNDGDGGAAGGTPTTTRRPKTVTIWSYDVDFDPDKR